jgi:hypothetical protein
VQQVGKRVRASKGIGRTDDGLVGASSDVVREREPDVRATARHHRRGRGQRSLPSFVAWRGHWSAPVSREGGEVNHHTREFLVTCDRNITPVNAVIILRRVDITSS